ncbi:MAG TPA: class I tRNA ligase family protein, partial [Geobacterales bacterium]|nr:class I tRNA ligase family protein [Geobacterales bacterium]
FMAASGSVDPAQLTDEGRELRRRVHKTIRKVTEDIDGRFHFNTAIAAIMELVNAISAFEPKNDPKQGGVLREAVERVVLMLAPFVPHVTAELWQALGHADIDQATWPDFDPAATVDDELIIVVQVNGKLRGRLTVPATATEDAVKAAALNDENVKSFTDGKELRKVIYVPGKLVNIVVAP